MFAGAGRIIDASVLVVLYMIPYSVWGVVSRRLAASTLPLSFPIGSSSPFPPSQNIFRGRLFACNDVTVAGKDECIGMFLSTPIDGVGTGFPIPRVWGNPAGDPSVWSFDDFRQSILILFEVVSLEGWIDVSPVSFLHTRPFSWGPIGLTLLRLAFPGHG